MAWIRADITNKFKDLSQNDISTLEGMLKRDFKQKDQKASIDLNFDDVYNNSIYTSWNSILGLLKYLKYYNLDIDVVLFTGHAGNGHRAPTRAIARKLIQSTQKNVIIIDPLALLSKNIAHINDKAWVILSRYELGQEFWNKFVRGEVKANGTGVDISPIFKLIYTKRLRKLIDVLQPKVLISTYPYSNAILSEIAKNVKSVKFAGVVVTDTEMLGFAMSSYKDVSNLHYFVSSEQSWKNGLKIYPYLKDAMEPIYIGGNPCFFDGEADNTNTVKDTVLFVPGSAEGLGMGIRALPKLVKYCSLNSKKLICISGLGNPYRYAKKIHSDYKKTMSLFSYVSSEDLKNLICSCEVIIAKAGGNMSSELVSKSGCKIFFESIKGQETDNAEYYAKLGVATNVENDVNALLKAVEEKPYTPSIYEKGIMKKSAVSIVVDTILPYL